LFRGERVNTQRSRITSLFDERGVRFVLRAIFELDRFEFKLVELRVIDIIRCDAEPSILDM
jgi:hypothetical protein